MPKQDTPPAAKAATLTSAERTLVEAAIQELQDVSAFGTPDSDYIGIDDDMSAVEQVEMTREAVAKAMKAITRFRARAVRQGAPS